MKLDCERADPLLSAYLDGELAREEAKALAEHLTHCAECGGEVQELEKTKTLLSREWKPAMPDDLAARIRDSLAVAERSSSVRGPWKAAAGLALAAGLAVVIYMNSSPPQPVPIGVFLAEHRHALSGSPLGRRGVWSFPPVSSESAQG
jgi:anti-sigma factor RsiW